jgi:hypothetical protein
MHFQPTGPLAIDFCSAESLQKKMGPEKGPLSEFKEKDRFEFFALMKRLRYLYALSFNAR